MHATIRRLHRQGGDPAQFRLKGKPRWNEKANSIQIHQLIRSLNLLNPLDSMSSTNSAIRANHRVRSICTMDSRAMITLLDTTKYTPGERRQSLFISS